MKTAIIAMIFATATAVASELSEDARIRGETVYGPGSQMPTTSIHITTRPSKPIPERKPNNANPPKGQYDEKCHPYVQMASYSTDGEKYTGQGQWRDHGGTLHKGEWTCTATTTLVYNNRLGLNAQCDKTYDSTKGIHIRLAWRADIVVVDHPKKKHTCKVKSGKGVTRFLTAIKRNRGNRPVKQQGKKMMEIGKKKLRLRLPADGGAYFTLTLKNNAFDDYENWR